MSTSNTVTSMLRSWTPVNSYGRCIAQQLEPYEVLVAVCISDPKFLEINDVLTGSCSDA